MKIKDYLAWAIGQDLNREIKLNDIDIHWEEKNGNMIQCEYNGVDFEISFDEIYEDEKYFEIEVHRDGSIACYTWDLGLIE